MFDRSWKRYAGLFVVSFGLLAIVWAAPADMMSLDGCGDKKAAVEFDHAKHVAAAEKCSDCHHTQEDLTADSDATVETCKSCHFEPEEADTPDCSSMSPSKNPYHKNCVGCHKALVKEDSSSAAPVKCDGCHPKN